MAAIGSCACLALRSAPLPTPPAPPGQHTSVSGTSPPSTSHPGRPLNKNQVDALSARYVPTPCPLRQLANGYVCALSTNARFVADFYASADTRSAAGTGLGNVRPRPRNAPRGKTTVRSYPPQNVNETDEIQLVSQARRSQDDRAGRSKTRIGRSTQRGRPHRPLTCIAHIWTLARHSLAAPEVAAFDVELPQTADLQFGQVSSCTGRSRSCIHTLIRPFYVWNKIFYNQETIQIL